MWRRTKCEGKRRKKGGGRKDVRGKGGSTDKGGMAVSTVIRCPWSRFGQQ